MYSTLLKELWSEHYNMALNKLNHSKDLGSKIEAEFLVGEWFKVFDLIQSIIFYSSRNEHLGVRSENYRVRTNQTLEEYKSAYRFLNEQIVPIISETEKRSLELVLESDILSKGVKEHLATALKLYSDRTAPDYRNSIKESISAVEALCKQMTGKPKATLGDALAILKQKKNINGALLSGLDSIFGYTSNAQGIRHSLKDGETPPTSEDALFMLVTCSAFINYLTSKIVDVNHEIL